ncbi:MAG: hypothetical protein RL518_1654 [Pseudomonadota bacterium]|jgi:hypothetical protein
MSGLTEYGRDARNSYHVPKGARLGRSIEQGAPPTDFISGFFGDSIYTFTTQITEGE